MYLILISIHSTQQKDIDFNQTDFFPSLPNTHSFFNICWWNSISKIDDKFSELFHIDYVFCIITTFVDYFCTTCYLQWLFTWRKISILFVDYSWRKSRLCSACLSAAKSHNAGGARPVSDSLIPDNSFTRFNIVWTSSSVCLIALSYGPAP